MKSLNKYNYICVFVDLIAKYYALIVIDCRFHVSVVLFGCCWVAALFLSGCFRMDVHRGHTPVPDCCRRHLQQRLPTPQLLHIRLWQSSSGCHNLCNSWL